MYEKLGQASCKCLCATAHPGQAVCRGAATGDVGVVVQDVPVMIPMCRPCADQILAAEIAKTGYPG